MLNSSLTRVSIASAPFPFFQEFDEKTDVMADKAVESVAKGVTSLWSSASGYAKNMFMQEDSESEAILVREKGPVLLDRLQAQVGRTENTENTTLSTRSVSTRGVYICM